jgi:autophagy-related protein 18
VALSPSSDNSYLAYPSIVPSSTTANLTQPPQTTPTQQSGDIFLFSTRSLTVANVIQAHKAPISFLSINSTGTILASASDKGTVIRVWSIPGAEKLYQFRRGTREARIYSMNFNLVSTLLAVSSAHDTVHIFKLGPQRSSPQSRSKPPSSPGGSVDSRDGSQTALDAGYDAYVHEKKNSSVSWVNSRFLQAHSLYLNTRSSLRRRSLNVTKSLTASVGTYLPSAVTEMWEPSRDFAFLRLPTSGSRCVVALSG